MAKTGTQGLSESASNKPFSKENYGSKHRSSFLAFGGIIVVLLVGWIAYAMQTGPSEKKAQQKNKEEKAMANSDQLAKATFGGGCFWCTEAIYQEMKGVKAVISGYSGGKVKNPTYKQVCNGDTGHAEVVQISYDPKKVSFQDLLEVFWETHDPTTLNRQGADFGTQYRSVVFYHNDEQKKIAEDLKNKLDRSGAFAKPIVTEITKFSEFYPAEDYHQNYFELNGNQPYCASVIRPKMEKFRKVFEKKLKTK